MKYLSYLLAVSCFGLAGCQKSAAPIAVVLATNTPPVVMGSATNFSITYTKPVPALPPTGMVRIVPQKIQSDAKTVHWKWMIVTDRNWSGMQGDLFDAVLSGSYPLKSTTQFGGSNAAELDLHFTASTFQDGTPTLETKNDFRFIGRAIESGPIKAKTDGGYVSGGGPIFVKGKTAIANEVVKPLLTTEQVLPLPLDKPVLEVTARKPDGTIYKQAFRLKIPK